MKQVSNSNKTPIFFPDLDGWRFIAFLVVFLFHASHSTNLYIQESVYYQAFRRLVINGPLGVDFFFVLSGFLIIYLLIAERRETGRIDVKKFYIRRVLRIFPLYYLCLFIGFVLLPFVRKFVGMQPLETPDWQYYVVFLSNLAAGQSEASEATLGVLWSVSIEEQFYLTVPLILMVVSTRFYPIVFFAVIALSLVFRAANLDDGYLLARHTLSFVGNLAVGGLIAYYSISSDRFIATIETLSSWTIKLGYLLILFIFLFQSEIFFHPILRVFQATIISCLFAFLIMEQIYARNSFFKMRNNKWFSGLGKYTYGLYCLHVLALAIAYLVLKKVNLNQEAWQMLVIQTPLGLGLSLTMAYLSYRFFEMPFLKLKNKFSFQNTRLREG